MRNKIFATIENKWEGSFEPDEITPLLTVHLLADGWKKCWSDTQNKTPTAKKFEAANAEFGINLLSIEHFQDDAEGINIPRTLCALAHDLQRLYHGSAAMGGECLKMGKSPAGQREQALAEVSDTMEGRAHQEHLRAIQYNIRECLRKLADKLEAEHCPHAKKYVEYCTENLDSPTPVLPPPIQAAKQLSR